MQRFCRVAVDSAVLALDRPFDYEIPERLLGRVEAGSVVRVMLHGRNVRGFVIGLLDEAAVPNPQPLRSVVASEPVFAATELDVARWAARRYVATLGHVLHDAVPGRFSAPPSGRASAAAPARMSAPSALGGRVSELIASQGSACVFPATLDDEIDLAAHVAGECAAMGGRTLVICARVEQAEAIANVIAGAMVIHGAERPRERAEAWAAGRDGVTHVLVGGRSALLAPVRDLRAVCVLSAHDRSLKSERAPRLHGVIVAAERARKADAAFLASSPAPPLEVAAAENVTWIEGSRGPVKTEIARPRGGPVTPRLIEVVRSAVDGGEDALVFVGRRGNTLRLRCEDCGWHPTCPRCGAGLAPGDEPGRLSCRVCGSEAAAPATCPSCGGRVGEKGWGHERVARALERADLGAPVIRVVRGMVPTDRPRPAVIVGTLAAVHAVGLVGSACVADLDPLLARPDFRAAERALQTLHELAGVLRPGGRFLVQTREPDHHAVQAFTRRSYRFFFDREMEFRKQTRYPPFGVVVRVETRAGDVDDLRRSVEDGGGEVIGTVERKGAVIALVRGPELDPLLGPLREFALAHSRTRIDVDPVDVI